MKKGAGKRASLSMRGVSTYVRQLIPVIICHSRAYYENDSAIRVPNIIQRILNFKRLCKEESTVHAKI